MKLWWICPKCGEKVDFQSQMTDYHFDAKSGDVP